MGVQWKQVYRFESQSNWRHHQWSSNHQKLWLGKALREDRLQVERKAVQTTQQDNDDGKSQLRVLLKRRSIHWSYHLYLSLPERDSIRLFESCVYCKYAHIYLSRRYLLHGDRYLEFGRACGCVETNFWSLQLWWSQRQITWSELTKWNLSQIFRCWPLLGIWIG